MGRPPLKEDETKEISVKLIESARTLIVSDGLENVTIRKIAKKAGLNSASMYKFFQDLDELLLFACVDLFRAYCDALIKSTNENQEMTPREAYLTSWKLFCQYAFKYPEGINHLFFSRHSDNLTDVIEAYYKLFPGMLDGMTDQFKLMMRASDLYDRNLEVLRPLLSKEMPQKQVILINELTVSYFRMLLNEKMLDADKVDCGVQVGRMLRACDFLIDCSIKGPLE